MKQLQLVTYQCDFEMSVAGLFKSEQIISKEMIAENIQLMAKEQFPELDINAFNECTKIQNGDIKADTIMRNLFLTLKGIKTSFCRIDDDLLDEMIEWECNQEKEGKVMDVFEWMISKGIIEKAEYKSVYIPHSGS